MIRVATSPGSFQFREFFSADYADYADYFLGLCLSNMSVRNLSVQHCFEKCLDKRSLKVAPKSLAAHQQNIKHTQYPKSLFPFNLRNLRNLRITTLF
jgi:hypothetical protein